MTAHGRLQGTESKSYTSELPDGYQEPAVRILPGLWIKKYTHRREPIYSSSWRPMASDWTTWVVGLTVGAMVLTMRVAASPLRLGGVFFSATSTTFSNPTFRFRNQSFLYVSVLYEVRKVSCCLGPPSLVLVSDI